MDMHGELAMPIKHYTSFLQIKFDEVGYYMLYGIWVVGQNEIASKF